MVTPMTQFISPTKDLRLFLFHFVGGMILCKGGSVNSRQSAARWIVVYMTGTGAVAAKVEEVIGAVSAVWMADADLERQDGGWKRSREARHGCLYC